MSTNFDSAAIKTSANNLGSIMDDMAAFTNLKLHWPNAGKFPLAQWLERVVDDRRNGIVAQGEHLQLVLNELKATLVSIADNFDDADGDNANRIKKAIGNIENSATEDVGKYDKATENQQHNFSGGPQDNDKDGDGYNDALPTPKS